MLVILFSSRAAALRWRNRSVVGEMSTEAGEDARSIKGRGSTFGSHTPRQAWPAVFAASKCRVLLTAGEIGLTQAESPEKTRSQGR